MKTNNPQRTGAARWWMVVIIFLGGAAFSAGESVEMIFEDGFEDRPVQLDCERLGYPCSLVDADPDALSRARALLRELWDIRTAGTMQDCYEHLDSQADVVAIYRGDTSLVFQVDGMMPVVFHDTSVFDSIETQTQTLQVKSSPPGKVKPHVTGLSMNRLPEPDVPFVIREPMDTPGHKTGHNMGAATHDKKRKDQGSARIESVVGEDRDMTGVIDQLDNKLAWVYSPYEWMYPGSETDTWEAIFESIPPYQNSIKVTTNLLATDYHFDWPAWESIAKPDVLVIATLSGLAEAEVDGQPILWMGSGIGVRDLNELVNQYRVGASFGTHWLENIDIPEETDNRYVLFPDFFREPALTRDKSQLIISSFFQLYIGLARVFDHVSKLSIGTTYGGFTESLDTRLPFFDVVFQFLAQGLDHIEAERLARVETGVSTERYSFFSPDNDKARIVELPRWMAQVSGGWLDAPLGYPLHELVIGTVGDGENDKLIMDVHIDGVTTDTKDEFQVRFRVASKEVPGSYDLRGGNAYQVNGFDYRWGVRYDLDLGFPLHSGPVPIEIIVDLPEGGESRYTGLGSLASCHFVAKFSGEGRGIFAGPAAWEFTDDGRIDLSFLSTELIWALDPFQYPVWQAGVISEVIPGPVPTPFDLNAQSAELNLGLLNYIFNPAWGEEFTCDDCGGSIKVEEYEEETVSGTLTATMVRAPSPEEKTVTLEVDFVALKGNLLDSSSPFRECVFLYDP